jgi:diguanylate cyclase (GGDEF)-like protein
MASNAILHGEDRGFFKAFPKVRAGKSGANLHRRLIVIHQLAADLMAAADAVELQHCLDSTLGGWLPSATIRLFSNPGNHHRRAAGSGDDPIGWTRGAGIPVIIENTLADLYPEEELHPPEANSRAIISLPLRSSGHVLGCLVIHSAKPGRFTPLDCYLASLVAAHVVSALENIFTRRQLREASRRYHEQEQKLMELHRQLQKLAHTDELTALYNKRRLQSQLENEVSRARRYGSKISCLMIDLDRFKPINDTHGHMAGDQVLAELGSIFRKSSRESDFIARYGGDEFTILLPQTDARGALCAAEKLRRKVEEHRFDLGNGQQVSLTLSIGVTTSPDQGPLDAHQIISRADEAMYLAKRAGGNAICASTCDEGGSRICQPAEPALTQLACSA